MIIELNHRRYDTSELIGIPPGGPQSPSLFITTDLSEVIVMRPGNDHAPRARRASTSEIQRLISEYECRITNSSPTSPRDPPHEQPPKRP
jgi:hypothetical protein